MNGLDVSPATLRRHAAEAEDTAEAVRARRLSLGDCHLGDNAFGVFFGFMRDHFHRAREELVDALVAQGTALDNYASGLRDTATEFEGIEAAIALLFEAGGGR